MRVWAYIAAAVAVGVASVWGGLQLWDTIVPSEVEQRLDTKAATGTFDNALREEAESFEAVMRWLFVASQVAVIAVLVVYAKRGTAFMKESAAGPIGTGFLLGIMGIAMIWLVQLPFGLVETWWARKNDAVEAGYLDFVLGSFMGLTGQAVFLCLLLLIVMAFGRLLRGAWWLPGVAVLAGLTALLSWLSPYLIFELQKPSRAVATDAKRLAKKQGTADVPVRIEKVREYTDQPNAYAMGIGDTQRIVLWDTLAEDFERPQVRAVIAHEFGHLQHDHIAKGIGWFAVMTFPTALIVTLLTRRRGGLGQPQSIPLALLVFFVLQLAASPITSGSSRRMEAEADWAALEATRDPDSMVALHHSFTEAALSDPDPPGWFHWMFDSHPSGAERVAMAKQWQWYNFNRP